MKALESAEVRELKREKTRKLLAYFMLAILVLSSVGFAFYYAAANGAVQENANQEIQPITESSQIYQIGDRWAVPFSGQVFYLQKSPEQTSNVSVNINKTLSGYIQNQVYIDIKNIDLLNEVNSVILTYTDRVQEACYGKCEEDLPEKTCDVNMIVWKDSKEQRVYQDNNCVFIEGDITAVDAFIYNLLDMRTS